MTAIAVFVCIPFAKFILYGRIEFFPDLGLIYRFPKFIVHITLWVGTILWIWQEFFPDKKESDKNKPNQ